jgi:hypothetical protein
MKRMPEKDTTHENIMKQNKEKVDYTGISTIIILGGGLMIKHINN